MLKPMYYVAFGKDEGRYFLSYYILGVYETLQEAAKARRLAGDLVFNNHGVIVQDQSWLFDWEKEKPDGYAKRCILQRKTMFPRHFVLRRFMEA